MINRCFQYKRMKIKYFSTDCSNKLPNGSYHHKGSYCLSCINNSKKFFMYNFQYVITKTNDINFFNNSDQKLVDEYINSLKNKKGGMIVFPSHFFIKNEHIDVKNTVFETIMDKNNVILYCILLGIEKSIFSYLLKLFKKLFSYNKKVINYKAFFSYDYFFKGQYISKNNVTYDKNSFCIEVNYVSSNELYKISKYLNEYFDLSEYLIKDYNKNTIYLVEKVF